MTSVVIDANICLGLFLPLPYSEDVEKKFKQWSLGKTRLLAPVLWEYEVLSGLRMAEYRKLISHDDARLALEEVMRLQVDVISPSFHLHQKALDLSEKLGQARCYDAHYLALADQMDVALWTADQKLVNQCRALGLDWVYWIGG